MTPQWPVVWTVNMTRDKQNKIPATLKHSLKNLPSPKKMLRKKTQQNWDFYTKAIHGKYKKLLL